MILGIDPGTTVGWAFVDYSGKPVKVNSSRGLSFNLLLSALVKHGKILFIGCDKAKVPSFVQDAARKLGAKVISPNADLQVAEKRSIVKDFNCSNAHELDALASALFAFSQANPLLTKVKKFLSRENKPELFEDVLEIVIKDKISIQHAFDLLCHKKPKKSVKESKEYQLDVEKVFSSLLIAREQNQDLVFKLSQAANEIAQLKQLNNKLQQKMNVMVKPKSKDVVKSHYERKLKSINRMLSESRKAEKLSSKKLHLIEKYFLDNQFIALPKLKRLDWKSVKNHKEQVLFVEKGTEFSEKSVKHIAGEGVSFILFEKLPSRNMQKKLPFACIKAESFISFNNIVLVEKEWLDEVKSQKNVLDKVIREYQNRLIE